MPLFDVPDRAPADVADAASDPSRRRGDLVLLSPLAPHIHRAWHPRFGPVCARIAHTDPVARQQAKLVASLAHPSIPRVRDSFQIGDDLVVVLDPFEGLPLHQAPPTDPLRFARTLAEAVAYLHDRGIVHGGLTAQGVWSAPDGRALLVDFAAPARRSLGGVPPDAQDDADAVIALSRLAGAPTRLPAGLPADDSVTRPATVAIIDGLVRPEPSLEETKELRPDEPAPPTAALPCFACGGRLALAGSTARCSNPACPGGGEFHLCGFCLQPSFALARDRRDCANPACRLHRVARAECPACGRASVILHRERQVCINRDCPDNAAVLDDCFFCGTRSFLAGPELRFCTRGGCERLLDRVERCDACGRRSFVERDGACRNLRCALAGLPVETCPACGRRAVPPDGACRGEGCARRPGPTLLFAGPPAARPPRARRDRRKSKTAAEPDLRALLRLAQHAGTEDRPPDALFAGRYRLRECRHVGGMGEIWSAWDTAVERDVAIKMMRTEAVGIAAAREQFRKEAKLQARMMHPNIPPVFDIGEAPDGRLYFTSRYIEGASLRRTLDGLHVARGLGAVPLPLAKLGRLFLGVCDGVSFAHACGVLHCDLKPDNVILSRFLEVFVIDWGLAKLTKAPENYERYRSLYDHERREIGITCVVVLQDGHRERVAVGTPGYMAPEQAEGASDRYDERTDVCGLGGVLYAMLTGEAPFARAGEPRPASVARSRRAEVVPPRRVNAAVPERLEEICLRCLSRDPEARYAGVASLRDDVAGWLDGVR